MKSPTLLARPALLGPYPAAAGRHPPQSAQTDPVHQANDGVIASMARWPGHRPETGGRGLPAGDRDPGRGSPPAPSIAGATGPSRMRISSSPGPSNPCPPTCEATLPRPQSAHAYYLRRSVIAGAEGQPAQSRGGGSDQPPLKVVVTEGLGNWQHLGHRPLGRRGRPQRASWPTCRAAAQHRRLRAGQRRQPAAFTGQQADAWITWVHWP